MFGAALNVQPLKVLFWKEVKLFILTILLPPVEADSWPTFNVPVIVNPSNTLFAVLEVIFNPYALLVALMVITVALVNSHGSVIPLLSKSEVALVAGVSASDAPKKPP